MDVFEYLPQLIVAFDGNDEFANLIHVTKADKENNYYCPCCGGIVKPRALESNKEQSHYYHITGTCTKESQLHFFCKNWLFEKGSKFYIEDALFEVQSIDIEKIWNTPFGEYKPDITVYTTSGQTIFFEMFFSNRKSGDDYFCKWDALGNDVVEVNIKEYMYKTDKDVIPEFKYLYHNGTCYSKAYQKRDLYANTIAKIKRELTRQQVLNYKARIEQLDWFWQKVRNKDTKESILEVINAMNYEDMVSCYEIIKKKHCVFYLKNDVLNIINQKVISDFRKTFDLPTDDKDIYFDLEHVNGRTYIAGIRLILNTKHFNYNKLYSSCNTDYDFERLKKFPIIVFNSNIFTPEELVFTDSDIEIIKKSYDEVSEYKKNLLNCEPLICDFENEGYKVKVKNDFCTVLLRTEEGVFTPLFVDHYINGITIGKIKKTIDSELSKKEDQKFVEYLLSSDEYNSFKTSLEEYKDFNVYSDIRCVTEFGEGKILLSSYVDSENVCNLYFKRDMNDFIKKTSECKIIIQKFVDSYSILIGLVNKINGCKNKFWKAQLNFDGMGYATIKIDQKYFIPKQCLTFENIRFVYLHWLTEEEIIERLKDGMKQVLRNMEYCGYRVMEVRDY